MTWLFSNMYITKLIMYIYVMKELSVTEAREQFPALLNQAATKPVWITRHGVDVAVVISPELFESFFVSQFSNTLILRLPGLFGSKLKKNFIFDLANKRSDQFQSVHSESIFQFYDITGIWHFIEKCNEEDISLLNVATEPITAQEIASIFDVSLSCSGKKVEYLMKSKHFNFFQGNDGFLQNKAEVLKGISNFRNLN